MKKNKKGRHVMDILTPEGMALLDFQLANYFVSLTYMGAVMKLISLAVFVIDFHASKIWNLDGIMRRS